MSMHADEESDEGVVPMKRSNNEGVSSAETVEGRTSPRPPAEPRSALVDPTFGPDLLVQRLGIGLVRRRVGGAPDDGGEWIFPTGDLQAN